MPDIVLHPATRQAIDQFIDRPSHAVLLVGPRGAGKGSLARILIAEILKIPTEMVPMQPYVKFIGSDGAGISIDTTRELEHFLSRKVPGNVSRIVLIEDAEGLTTEAQNALLKTLEEPPQGSIIIMTASSSQSLLPTVRSRLMLLPILRPEAAALSKYFRAQGYPPEAISKNLLLSGGLPGLLAALLAEDKAHPLVEAAAVARDIVQKGTFERLAMVNSLVKQRSLCLDILQILQQMAHVALLAPNAQPRWQQIMEYSYEAARQLEANAQPKLVLTYLMLSV